MRTTATSTSGSAPTRPASKLRPSASVTRIRRAWATTWALVRICPSEAKMSRSRARRSQGAHSHDSASPRVQHQYAQPPGPQALPLWLPSVSRHLKPVRPSLLYSYLTQHFLWNPPAGVYVRGNSLRLPLLYHSGDRARQILYLAALSARLERSWQSIGDS